MPTMKSFKMSNLNTDAEGSPPPPPAPADPSVEAANAAVAAAAAAAAQAADGGQVYNDMYPTYNTYLMTRYSDQRYHTPSYSTQTPGGYAGSHISSHTSTDSGYYRYPDYSRYPYSGGNPSGPTSPRWRRRSYDPEYLSTTGSRSSRNTGSAGSVGSTSAGNASSNNRPLSDLAASLVNSPGTSGTGTSGSTSSSVLMRSRSRSRVPSEYDPNAYLRYVSPSTASSAYSSGSGSTRPMSG